MTIKLYHCRDARSMRPLWTLEELGVDYELVNMEFPPRHHHRDYLDVNPLGTVPALSIDGVVMTESSAMAQYLVERFAPTNLALDISHSEYALYLNWLHRSDTTLTFPQTLILRYTMLEKNERRQPQVAADYTQWFLSRMRSVEDALVDREYLVADRFTIADICVGYAIFLGRKLKLDKNFGPRTLAYLDRITDRPGFKNTLEKQAGLKALF